MTTVRVAKTAGFCKGVRRAVEKVFAIANKTDKKTVTLGPVIHNPQVLEQLHHLGIESIKEPMEGRDKYVIIRAHGIPPSVREELRKENAVICDATCPDVGKVQGLVKKYANKGYSVIIIGDANHAEIQGIMGFADGNGYVVDSVDDVAALPDLEKVAVVVQTTHQKKSFFSICDAIMARYGEERCVVNDTICPATMERQEEVRRMAQSSDLMVVIGGKNSANTARLAKIAEQEGTQTLHIETEKELKDINLSRYHHIGVTAGASTPNWMIKQVVLSIKEKLRMNYPLPFRMALMMWDMFRYLHLLVSFAAASLTYAICYLLKLPSKKEYFFVSFFYILTMYTVHSLQRRSFMKLNKPAELYFYDRHRLALFAMVFLSVAAVLWIAFKLGVLTFCVAIALLCIGSVYQILRIPFCQHKSWQWRRVRHIPGSKDIFVILGWGTMVVFVPLLSTGGGADVLAVFTTLLFVMTVVAIRSIVNDIREIQEDMMVGIETLPILIGKKMSMNIIKALVISTTLVIVASSVMAWTSLSGLMLLVALWGIYILALSYKRFQYAFSVNFNDLVDLFLIITGMGYFLLHLHVQGG